MAHRSPDPHARVAGSRVSGPHPRRPRAADEPRPSLAYRPGVDSRVERRRVERRRMLRRRRRTAVLTLLLTAAGLIGLDLARDRPLVVPPFTTAGRATDASPRERPPEDAAPGPATPTAAIPNPTPTTTLPPPPAPSPTPAPPAPTPQPIPAIGSGDFGYAAAAGPVLGGAGTLRRFRVAVEGGMGMDPAAFAAATDRILGDPRSWTAGGDLRFQRVPQASPADFTLYLASARTSQRMCATGGLDTDGYTSCRLPGQVIINATRWTEAVPGYGAPLEEYQAYAVNHEVGHQLGYGHEACTGSGQVAPVMQQQTLGMQGCAANGWPYLDGRRVTGPAVP